MLLPIAGALWSRDVVSRMVALDDRTWRYSLDDPSAANVMALVRDTAVEDTHGVDHVTGAITQAPATVETEAETGNEMLTGTMPCANAGTQLTSALKTRRMAA